MTFGILMVLMFDGNSKIDAQLGKEQSLLSGLLKAFDREQSQITFFFLRKDLHACATRSGLPSNISTMQNAETQLIDT